MARTKKKTLRIALFYFLTIFVFIIMLGFGAYFVMEKIFLPDESFASNKNSSKIEYVPTTEDATTILFVGADDKKLNVLMLMQVEPVHSEIICIPIPVETVAKVNTKQATLKSFYEKDGIESLRSAVMNTFGIPAERYMVVNKEAFGELVESLGGLCYDLPSDLFYYNRQTGEMTNFKAEDKNVRFCGEDLKKIMTYPLYPNGQEYNANITGGIIRALINNSAKSKDVLQAHFDEIYYGFATLTENNITDVDYDILRKAFLHIINTNDTPTDYFVPDGKRLPNGSFSVDSDFKAKLLHLFHIEN